MGDKFPFPIFIINLNRKPERYRYVRDQLNKLGINNYRRVTAIDGFNTTTETFIKLGITAELTQRKGLAGCAASHVAVWKHIAEYKLDWVLILEDDAHFHPEFVQLFNAYWSEVPKDAKIVFPGFCTNPDIEQSTSKVIKSEAMCLQGYMLSHIGAKYLLDNLLPIHNPIDIDINDHFKTHDGSYIFNGNISINGIRPNDYKESNGRRCMFNGIIYQNQEEQGSCIHKLETVF